MTRSLVITICLSGFICGSGSPATAQQLGECTSQKAWTIDRIGKDYLKLSGQAEVECGDAKFYADDYIEIFADTKRLVAVGNVVFIQDKNRIAGDRAEFNYEARTGTFYNASGIASLGQQVDRSMFGTQEPDVYFYGETLEKLGPRKYKVTKGGFTTCVQPTPRWELTSGSVVINIDDYALLTNSLFKVKGVPVLYLPLFYYPIQEDDRATGFLIPSYGTSTIKGHTVSNAFFWAINRSQDATLLHDWFSNTGQGLGGEYRYVRAPGSEGNLRAYHLREHESTFASADGTTTIPARRSYEIRGNATQALARRVHARARADYFSDITVQQTYNSNIYEASRRQRLYMASVSGNWGPYSLNGLFDRSEYFFGTSSSSVNGSAPRISASRAERPIFRSPVYFSIAGDYARLVRENRSDTQLIDNSLGRVDFTPLVRVPFTRWPFFTVNSSLAWRNTYWSESKDENGIQIDEPISRRYFDFQSNLVGPIFNRIFNTPNSGYAEKFKHSIEPFVVLQRITAIDEFDRIVQLDSIDVAVGNTTRVGYGLNNRLYAKRKTGGPTVQSTEILNVSIQQTYYTDERAAQFDRLYRTSFSGTPPTHFSPVSLVARASPAERINGTLRAEYDTQFKAFRTIGADGSVSVGRWLQTGAGWSQRRFIADLPGFNDRNALDHYINSQTTLRTRENRFGGTYSFNYDLLRDTFLQQRLVGYYNAQCCGFAVEYQSFDFSRLGSRSPVPRDTRFNFSFTLAGIGSFSNFFGALGGVPR